MSDVNTVAMQRVKCVFCDAKPGEPCRAVSSGTKYKFVHSGRWWDARNRYFTETDDGYVLKEEAA